MLHVMESFAVFHQKTNSRWPFLYLKIWAMMLDTCLYCELYCCVHLQMCHPPRDTLCTHVVLLKSSGFAAVCIWSLSMSSVGGHDVAVRIVYWLQQGLPSSASAKQHVSGRKVSSAACLLGVL